MDRYASVAWALLRQEPPNCPNLDYLRDVHHFMFGRLFDWAGEDRKVELSPAGVDRDYCSFREIEDRMSMLSGQLSDENYLRGLDGWDFCSRLAEHWAELTFIHPFRDGNTRSQSLWASEMATGAGHELDWTKINPQHLRDARLSAWNGFPMNLANYLYDRLLPPESEPVNPSFAAS